MSRHNEFMLQCRCVDHLTYSYSRYLGLWNHSPNEGKRTPRQGADLRRMGMRKGWPDLEILANGKVIFVEFKCGTGRLSAEQKEMTDLLESQGFTCYVCRSIEEFHDICRKELGEPMDPDLEQLRKILAQ